MRHLQTALAAVCLGVVATVGLGSGAAFAAEVTGSAEAGAKKVSQCQGCHGIPNYQIAFPQVYRVPKLGGQNAAYLASALSDYRKGDRRYPTMRAVAQSLSDQDIADIASYYAQVQDARP